MHSYRAGPSAVGDEPDGDGVDRGADRASGGGGVLGPGRCQPRRPRRRRDPPSGAVGRRRPRAGGTSRADGGRCSSATSQPNSTRTWPQRATAYAGSPINCSTQQHQERPARHTHWPSASISRRPARCSATRSPMLPMRPGLPGTWLRLRCRRLSGLRGCWSGRRSSWPAMTSPGRTRARSPEANWCPCRSRYGGTSRIPANQIAGTIRRALNTPGLVDVDRQSAAIRPPVRTVRDRPSPSSVSPPVNARPGAGKDISSIVRYGRIAGIEAERRRNRWW